MRSYAHCSQAPKSSLARPLSCGMAWGPSVEWRCKRHVHSGLSCGRHSGQPRRRQMEESKGSLRLKQQPLGGQQLWVSFHFPHL